MAIFSLFTFHFSLYTSCTPDPPPTLTFQERELVDSLFRLRVDSLKPIMDSLCDMRYDSAVQFKSDSIMRVRQAEIERYLKRIRQAQQ